MPSAIYNVGKPRLERTHFNLKYRKLFNCDMGQLIPVQCDLIIPGDVIRLTHDIVVRLNPLVAPILNEINVDTHTFFTPIRIADEDWEESSSGGEDGNTTKVFPRWIPSVNPPQMYSLWDYMGHPINTQIAAPFPTDWHRRAYNIQWNEFFRDENLQPEVALDNEEILYRSFRKDYFTSALKETQKGTAPGLPIAGTASAEFEGLLPIYQDVISRTIQKDLNIGSPPDVLSGGPNIGDTYKMKIYQSLDGFQTPATIGPQRWDRMDIAQKTDGWAYPGSGGVPNSTIQRTYGMPTGYLSMETPTGGYPPQVINSNVGEPAHQRLGQITYEMLTRLDESFRTWLNNNSINFDSALTYDVNDLRAVIQQQKFMERNARIGIRYTEQLRGRWDTAPRDDRLQRPEFLGGTRSPIIVSEVLQTSETASSPQGNLAGHGLAANIGKVRKYRAQEWGILMTVMSIMPKVGYAQGIDRQWLYESRYDLPAPEFTHLGEREILTTEIYTTGNESANRTIWGYRPMFDEHRLKQDMVCGDMRVNLNYWHLNREFDASPQLNGDFITTKNNIRKDIFVVHDEPGFIVHVGNRLSIVRSLPALGEPGLIDHF